jgi:ABC-type dipeptide/oligopeptide/nickel transport system permease component
LLARTYNDRKATILAFANVAWPAFVLVLVLVIVLVIGSWVAGGARARWLLEWKLLILP